MKNDDGLRRFGQGTHDLFKTKPSLVDGLGIEILAVEVAQNHQGRSETACEGGRGIVPEAN